MDARKKKNSYRCTSIDFTGGALGGSGGVDDGGVEQV
jgi:hypothetical protein